MALLSFCDPVPQKCLEEFTKLSASEWKRLLRWLHLSGLGLYFFHRMHEVQAYVLLPESVSVPLQKNLEENTDRTYGMLIESIEIQQDFRNACLRYAVLKGLSLWPGSVPSPELRLQFDLDFLVAQDELQKAREILENRGYRLYRTRGQTWEFKRNEMPGLDLKDVYRNTGSWMVELHVEPGDLPQGSLLERVQWRDFYGFDMPVLSPVDLFLGQGIHAYKHACSEFPRAGFLVEFRRNVLFHENDSTFWKDLRACAGNDSRVQFQLGIVCQFISRVMGNFAPQGLTEWTVDRLPRPARLWVEMYGPQVMLGSFPGNKLYLFLRDGLMERANLAGKSTRQALLPLSMPPFQILALSHESASVRFGRYWMYLGLFVLRLRFHIVEGLRFWWESYRWRRANRTMQ